MFFKFLNKANTTQPLSEPQEAVSPLPEELHPHYDFSQVKSRLPHDGVDDSWLLDLKNIGATLTEQRLGVQPPEDVKTTSKGPKGNNQLLPVNLNLILRAVQSLSANLPTVISSLQFGLESLQKKVEEDHFLIVDRQDYIENDLPENILKSLKP